MPKVTIYTTAACPYCRRAKNLLTKLGLSYTEIPVDGDDETREAMAARAHGRRTVPQIFFDDDYVGDCDELHELARNGELERLLAGEAR